MGNRGEFSDAIAEYFGKYFKDSDVIIKAKDVIKSLKVCAIKECNPISLSKKFSSSKC